MKESAKIKTPGEGAINLSLIEEHALVGEDIAQHINSQDELEKIRYTANFPSGSASVKDQ